jgi:hypothetical protein
MLELTHSPNDNPLAKIVETEEVIKNLQHEYEIRIAPMVE